MSHDTSTKRIYIGGTAQNPIGVSLNDVNTIIQEGSLDLGTLCKSDNINMWAKYKPVEYNTWGLTGKTSLNNYWKGDDGQCGLTIPRDTYNNRFAFAKQTVAWSRAKPTTKYRLLDFDGYNGSATVGSSTTIPTGRLTEENAGTIGFMGGVPVFHVDLNAQHGNDDFLTIDELRINISGNQVPLTDMYVHLLAISNEANNPTSFELKSGAFKVDREDHDNLIEMTLGEIREAGMTQLTFAPDYEFTVSSFLGTPAIGDSYTNGTSTFMIKSIVYDPQPPTISTITCIRTSGTANVPLTGTLTPSGGGYGNIAYSNMYVDTPTLGGRTFYVLPFLYSSAYSYVCGLGLATPQIVLASVTNFMTIQANSVQWSKTYSTVSFAVSGQISSGINAQRTVTLHFYTDNSLYDNNLFDNPDRVGHTTETVSVNALSTVSFSYTKTTPNNTYTGIYATYEYTDGEGHTTTGTFIEETIYDSNGNIHTPNS